MQNEIVVAKMVEIIEKLGEYVKGVDYNSFSNDSMLVEASRF